MIGRSLLKPASRWDSRVDRENRSSFGSVGGDGVDGADGGDGADGADGAAALRESRLGPVVDRVVDERLAVLVSGLCLRGGLEMGVDDRMISSDGPKSKSVLMATGALKGLCPG